MNEHSMIEQRLARIEVLLEQLADQNKADREWRGRMDITLNGDGNGIPGLRMRLDRMEQAGERAKWAMRTVAAAVVAMAAKTIAGMLGA